MIFNGKRNFNSILGNLKETINDYKWITEFNKCLINVNNTLFYIPMVEKMLKSGNFKEQFKMMFNIDRKFMIIFKMLSSLRQSKISFMNLVNEENKISFELSEYDLVNF